ncbi:MAG: hypothetical protein RLY86_4386, partial [Pseudomonadota bacterium]
HPIVFRRLDWQFDNAMTGKDLPLCKGWVNVSVSETAYPKG